MESGQEFVGRVFGERFRVEALIGVGGMGLVFRAHHVTLGNLVALKILRRDFLQDPATVQRFYREARACTRLKYHHTIKVQDFGVSDDGYPFIAMEYLEGRSLQQVLDEQGPLSVERVLLIASQIGCSLREAHAIGLVHRDLKPSNIFLTEVAGQRDYVKVLDFGIAKAIGSSHALQTLTGPGHVVGTPQYMAPEQFQSGPSDPRSDIYALGILLFQMLSGQLPFHAASAVEIIAKQLREQAPTMESLRPPQTVWPPPLCRLVDQMLLKSPGRRPQTVDTVLHRIAEIQTAVGRSPDPKAAHNAMLDSSRPITADFVMDETLAEEETMPLAGHRPSFDFSEEEDVEAQNPSEPDWLKRIRIPAPAEDQAVRAANLATDEDGSESARGRSDTPVAPLWASLIDPADSVAPTQLLPCDPAELRQSAPDARRAAEAATIALFPERMPARSNRQHRLRWLIAVLMLLLFVVTALVIWLQAASAPEPAFKPAALRTKTDSERPAIASDPTPAIPLAMAKPDVAEIPTGHEIPPAVAARDMTPATPTKDTTETASGEIARAVDVGDLQVALWIFGEPGGAMVYVDGKPRNAITPTTIRVPLGQPGVIQIRKKGFKSWTHKILFGATARLEYHLDVLPTPSTPPGSASASGQGILYLTVRPTGALVTIGGRPRGHAPLNPIALPPGTYLLGVSLKGYRSDEHPIEIQANKPHHVTVTLKPETPD